MYFTDEQKSLKIIDNKIYFGGFIWKYAFLLWYTKHVNRGLNENVSYLSMHNIWLTYSICNLFATTIIWWQFKIAFNEKASKLKVKFYDLKVYES